jgi:hypothetical protein
MEKVERKHRQMQRNTPRGMEENLGTQENKKSFKFNGKERTKQRSQKSFSWGWEYK